MLGAGRWWLCEATAAGFAGDTPLAAVLMLLFPPLLVLLTLLTPTIKGLRGRLVSSWAVATSPKCWEGREDERGCCDGAVAVISSPGVVNKHLGLPQPDAEVAGWELWLL